MSKDITEGFILDSYYANDQAPQLPLLWQILFQEGVRKNHILFSKEEVESFDFSSKEMITEDEKEILESAASQLLQAPDFRTMKNTIAECSPRIKRNLFVIYQSFLESWGNFMKNSLN